MDSTYFKVRKITQSGNVSTVAGSTRGYNDGKGSAGLFDALAGLVVDSAGVIYVADYGNSKIRKIAWLAE